jgi:hypothetical protein
MGEIMTNYPYPAPNVVPAPKRKRRALPWLIAVAVMLSICVAGTVAVAVGGSVKNADKLLTPTATTSASVKPGAVGPHEDDPAPRALTASDVALAVKTTKKDCFGSAGCNVEYSLRLTLTHTPGTDCEVTYDVHGLEDTQTGTLQVGDDGKYTQDDYQAGQTPKASTKLTAKVTDVDCS